MNDVQVESDGPSGTEKVPSLADPIDRHSIVNFVPERLAQSIEAHLAAHPEVFNIDEHDLHKLLRRENKQPTPTDNRIRLKFWLEWDRAIDKGDPSVNITSVLAGICTREFFYQNYLAQYTKVAWLLCPPVGYLVKTGEALEYGIDQLRDILGQDHMLYDGKVNVKLAELKLKIVCMLDTRVKGAVVQKSLNLQVHTNNRQVMKATEEETMEALQRHLNTLRLQDRRAQNLPSPGEKEVVSDPE